ncbi:hypothetical protein HYT04_01680, partial [Candidatus Kaiserbacteria bacterium]|nr:hypothetical protein [Candidatus Kaiserbacteria bacterium]
KGLAANLFIGGIAHEDDTKCGPWMREFAKWMSDPRLKGRFVYLPEYSERLRTRAVRGADIWVSCPWKRMEACGTSDFGAKMNGNINVATCGGGIREHGGEIDATLGTGDTLFIEPYNAEMLYLQLSRATGWMYDFLENGSEAWPRLRMNNFMRGADLDVSRMIEKYEKRCFEPLIMERQ